MRIHERMHTEKSVTGRRGFEYDEKEVCLEGFARWVLGYKRGCSIGEAPFHKRGV